MPPSSPARRALRRTAVGAVGAGAVLMALCATPAGAADPAPGLVLGDIATIDGVRPGSEFEVPASFTNTGGEALDGVWMTYAVTRGLGHTELPSNCSRFDVRSADEEPGRAYAVCQFDQKVEPGAVYAPEKPFTLKALDHALYDQLRVVVSTDPTGPADFDGTASEAVPGTAPAVRLAERPGATPAAPGSARHTSWDDAYVKVTADSTADLRVTGAELRGEAGAAVPLRVTLVNAGPGWVFREPGSGAARVRITMPAGTSVAEASGWCHDVGPRTYECGTAQSWIDENAVAATYDFRLRIDEAVAGAKGSVALAGKPRPFDPDASNDTAVISLDVVAGGGPASSVSGGGSSGAAGGSGPASGSGSGASGGDGSTGATADGATADGGPMADTGAGRVVPLAAAAAGALVLGAGAFLAARRRAARRR